TCKLCKMSRPLISAIGGYLPPHYHYVIVTVQVADNQTRGPTAAAARRAGSLFAAKPVVARRSDMSGLSIIIPAHNEAAVVARTLRSILTNKLDRPLQIIVVANGCTDQTA